MNETLRHRLPLLATAQAQKEITHNEALLAIDRRLQIAVATHGRNAPPAAPITGECHIVGALPVGAWAGQSDSIAMHDGFGWQFTVPMRGFVVYVGDAAVLAVYDAGWQVGAWSVSALRIGSRTVLGSAPVAVPVPAGGSVIDVELRSSFAKLLLALADQGVID